MAEPSSNTATATDADKVPNTTIRFFISSTFADFQIERNVLQRCVFPVLRRLCAASGFQLQPIDLRWGVTEEAGTEGQTLRICFDELERCRRLSPDLFLLILLGQRYGSYLLPPDVPAATVANLAPHLSSHERHLFDTNYRMDANAVPPTYALLRVERPHREEGEALRAALARAAVVVGLTDAERLPFEGSATNREIQFGLLSQPPDTSRDQGVLCALRTFAPAPAGPLAGDYVEYARERAEQVQSVRQAVAARLPDERTLHYEVPWLGAAGPTFDEEALASAYMKLLRPRVEAVIVARTASREAAAAHGRDAAALANAAFVAERAERVVGRDAELARLGAYMAGQGGVDAEGRAAPLVVTGVSGSGKSTLLAEAAKRAWVAVPGAVALVRYVGVTPGSETLALLLNDLRRSITAAYGRPTPEPVSDLYHLVSDVARLLETLEVPRERPLILVVDALDQLGTEAQSVGWLPRRLAPHVRVVISLMANRPELAELRGRLPADAMLTLGALDRATGRLILRHRLAREHRILNAEQEEATLDSFTAHGLPLYLQVAVVEARRWRSFDPVSPLPDTTTGLLDAILARLERADWCGPALVGHALGDLAAAKNGLAEHELLDLLARDAEVRDDLHRLSPHSPEIEPNLPLPAVIWARLAAEVEGLMTNREADGARLLAFYHRELREATQARYFAGQTGRDRHQDLARYFATQPLLDGTRPNQRKLSEQPAQEAAGDLAAELRHTLTDVSFMQYKIAYVGVSGALGDLALAPTDDKTVQLIAAVVRTGAVVLDREPSELPNQITGQVGRLSELHDLPHGPEPHFQLRTQSLYSPDFSLLHTFQGHRQALTTCALSANGRRILSASDDNTLRLWDATTGAELRQFEGHTSIVTACALNADGSRALSASDGSRAIPSPDGSTLRWDPEHGDSTLRIWDTATGAELRRFEGRFAHCALSADGRLALAVSSDGAIQLWDAASGAEPRQLDVHVDRSVDCALSADGRLIVAASVSNEGALRLLDAASGAELRRFGDRAIRVKHCALSADGRLALSATYEGDMQLWDTASGAELRHVESHEMSVEHLALSADGRLALYVATDYDSLGSAIENSVHVWDTTTGAEWRRVEGRSSTATYCALSADGRLALSASQDGILRLWNTAAGAARNRVRGHEDKVRGCALSADGRLALSASGDGTVRLWDTESGAELRRFVGHTSDVSDCALSADGRLALSTTRDGTVRLWDPESGAELRRFEGHMGRGQCCALSADGRRALAASQDNTVRLWDTESGAELRHFVGHTSDVSGCALSADGRLALSASNDGTVRLWDTANGQQLTYSLIGVQLLCCALSSQGLALAGDEFGGVHILDVVGVDFTPLEPGSVAQGGGASGMQAEAAQEPTRPPEHTVESAKQEGPVKRHGWWPFGRPSRV